MIAIFSKAKPAHRLNRLWEWGRRSRRNFVLIKLTSTKRISNVCQVVLN